MSAYRERASAEAYERELGEDTAARQRRERIERFPCCGELQSVGHHPVCPKRPAEVPAHAEGQVPLL